jgi:hypothetical protein
MSTSSLFSSAFGDRASVAKRRAWRSAAAASMSAQAVKAMSRNSAALSR